LQRVDDRSRIGPGTERQARGRRGPPQHDAP
jgi:hypothetical protein